VSLFQNAGAAVLSCLLGFSISRSMVTCQTVRSEANILIYPDFTVRRAHESHFSRRILVAGFSLSW